MKLKSALIAVSLYVVAFAAHAQYRAPQQSNSSYRSNSNSSFSDRIYFGGGAGFSGGQDYINVSVSPIVGYKITEKFSTGVQLTYQYVKILGFQFNNYGGGPFMRYNVTEKFFGYTEYEYLNYGFFGSGTGVERLNFYSWFVGLGYSEPISSKVSFNITALYNVLYGDGSNSPYSSPFVFRAGIVVGL